MDHYVAYHSTEAMGRGYSPTERFAFFRQVEVGTSVAGTPAAGIMVATAASGGVGLVAGTEVTGAARTMKGLGRVAKPLGCKAGGAVVAIGIATVAVSVPLLKRAFRDDHHAPHQEREARRVARDAVPFAVTGGGAVALVASATLGPVKDLSGAGITSGLKALGFGKMSVGTVVAFALPVLIAGVACWLLYRSARSTVGDRSNTATANA